MLSRCPHKSDYDWGLSGACLGGKLDIVKYMISKGARNFNSGLKYAYENGHIDICELMIFYGADYSKYKGLVLYIKRKRNIINNIFGSDIGSDIIDYLWKN
jgi:hypothetical protein